MLVHDRSDARRYFIEVRRKYSNNQPLEPMESLILDVILAHPEYHSVLDSGEDALDQDYSPEHGQTNPFLHMSLHITIKEQIQTDRPAGIRDLCDALLEKYGNSHDMEHGVMECLGESLWLAQRNNALPDEQKYLENVKALL